MGRLTNTVSGNIASFKSCAGADIKSLKCYFSPVQEGSGDPSPSNMREIGGWNNILTSYCNKNLLDESIRIDNSGVVQSFGGNARFITNGDLILPPGTYTFSTNGPAGVITIYKKGGVNIVVGYSTTSQTFTLNETTEIGIIYVNADASYHYQLEIGSIATAYIPHAMSKFPITFPNNETIYGGYVDLISGLVYKTHEQVIFNGSEDWTIYPHETYGNSFWIAITNKKIAESSSLCNIYKNKNRSYGSNGNQQYGIFCDHESLNRLYFKAPNDSITTLEQFKSWVSTNNLQLTYELATPILIESLSPQQLKTFMGQNNIWSNTNGQIEIEYDLHETKDIVEAKKRVLLAQPHLVTVSDSIAHFNTDMDIQIKEAKINFEPIQYGQGNPSPTNIRSITGWNKIVLDHSGKNMLKCDGYGNGTGGGITYTKHINENNIIDYITCSGKTAQKNCFRNLTEWQTANITRQSVPRGDIALNSFSDSANIIIIRPDGVPSGYSYPSSSDGGGINVARTGWFNWNTDIFDEYNMWARIQIYPYQANVDIDTIVYPMMCHIDDRGCEYESYYGTTTTIPWENDYGTIYGGYIDLINGKLVQTWNIVQIKNCAVGLNSNSTTAWHNWHVTPPNAYPMTLDFTDFICPIMCDTFTVITQALLTQEETNPIVWASHVDGTFRFKYATDCALTAAEFKTKYGEMTVAYKLATPIEYTLTPQQISAFKGTNNFWSNTNGDLTIKYWTH